MWMAQWIQWVLWILDLSSKTFNEELDQTRFIEPLSLLTYPICYLIDEFQYIFTSDPLLSVAREFSRSPSFFPIVTYVAVGTYHLVDLTNNIKERTLISSNTINCLSWKEWALQVVPTLSQPGWDPFSYQDQNCWRIKWPSGVLYEAFRWSSTS